MDLPINPPVEPMLAKSVPKLPTTPGVTYEPSGTGSGASCSATATRSSWPAGRQVDDPLLPEVVEQALRQLPERCAVDGELIVIRRDGPTGQPGWISSCWPSASTRPRPGQDAGRDHPADFVAFDLLAIGDEALLDQPYPRRRERLVEALAGCARRCTSPRSPPIRTPRVGGSTSSRAPGWTA
ncbi:hypothetical protein NKG94_23590 [Micromonospora sp. M12]